MPTYEYQCNSCEIEFERFQRISDDPLTVCPECGGEVRRLISTGGGLVFKGPGFYATDYGRGTSGRRSSEKPKPADSDTKSSGGSDASPSTGRDDSNAGG